MYGATEAWLSQLRKIVKSGTKVNPRGLPTIEVRNALIEYDPISPVVCVPERRLSARFLSGEALWILNGSDKVDEIAPYNERIVQYSDDGERFFGAYGPRIDSQIEHVLSTLADDLDSRQAVLTIWRENPPVTRDVPCTVAMAFSVRDRSVHLATFMRSSDVWLGLPYDMFNFAMVLARVTAGLSSRTGELLGLGSSVIFAASSHLYDDNQNAALKVLNVSAQGHEVADAIASIDRHSFGSRHAMRGQASYANLLQLLVEARDANRLPALCQLD